MTYTPQPRPSPSTEGARGSPHGRLTARVARHRRGSTGLGVVRGLYTFTIFFCFVVISLHVLASRYPSVGTGLSQFDNVIHYAEHPRDFITHLLGPLQSFGNQYQ